MVGNGYDMVLISVGASSVPPTPGEIFQLYLNQKGGVLQQYKLYCGRLAILQRKLYFFY